MIKVNEGYVVVVVNIVLGHCVAKIQCAASRCRIGRPFGRSAHSGEWPSSEVLWSWFDLASVPIETAIRVPQ